MDIYQLSRFLVSFVRGYADSVSSSFFLLHTFSDRGVWGWHRQLTGLVLLDPGGVSGGVNITFLAYSEGAYVLLHPSPSIPPCSAAHRHRAS